MSEEIKKNPTCSECKYGFKCAVFCVCTKKIENYPEFREKAVLFRNAIIDNVISKGKRQVKFDCKSFAETYLNGNLTDFDASCEDFVQKVQRENKHPKNDSHKTNKNQDVKKSDESKPVDNKPFEGLHMNEEGTVINTDDNKPKD